MLLGFLLVILVLVCIALATVILLQRSEGGAFGMGGGPSGLLTARGAGDLLTRITSILAAAFFILCLLLTILSGRARMGESVVDRLKVDALNPDALNKSMRPATAPAAGASPATSPASAPAGVIAPAPGAPISSVPAHGPTPAARSTFDAPAPQVHTLPDSAAPAARAPAVTTDSGARSHVSNVLGYQTAPQGQPTVAPGATRPRSPASSPIPATPPASAPERSTGAVPAGNAGQ